MTARASSSPARSWTTRCRARTICPSFVTECDESQPCTHNPLGAKGCGEAGSIGAPAALVSAALDALAALGVTDLEMPLTSRAGVAQDQRGASSCNNRAAFRQQIISRSRSLIGAASMKRAACALSSNG